MLKKAVFTMLGVFVFLSLGWAQPEYAPVPDGAKGPAIPETGYLVSGISDGVYWVTNGVYQGADYHHWGRASLWWMRLRILGQTCRKQSQM